MVVAGGWPDPFSTYTWDCTIWPRDLGPLPAASILHARATRRRCWPTTRCWLAGGMNGGTVTSAEVYDPATGNWTPTDSLNVPRWRHAATLLSDGKVLVAGGLAGNQSSLADAEIYDPATGTWTVTGSLNNARCLYTAMLLSDGRVLAAGGKTTTAFSRPRNFSIPVLPLPRRQHQLRLQRRPATIELTGKEKKVGGIDTSHLKWRGRPRPMSMFIVMEM
jgi:galactose oxidase-like protein